MTEPLYNIDNYTDSQLYDILDMNNPTDRELEAKILHLIAKYENMQNPSGTMLANFFHDIYKRFFSEEDEETIEGFTPDKPNDKSTNQNILSVQSFDYSQDKLQINPLIKQTIKRVISIDSQYRDVTTAPFTTDFTFDLSEPLRDVVSLKLYSIQIPYTWYTVSKSYGSNFFYLKGVTNGISTSNYSYKIAINPGTYTPTQLISAINTSFQDVSNNAASDVNFNGITLLTYDSNTSKTTINLNMQLTFNETYYSVNFPQWSTSIGNSYVRGNTIASYLGYNQTTYSANTIGSNQTYMNTQTLQSTNEQNQNYIVDETNNYFTVIQYIGPSVNDATSITLNTIKVTLLDTTTNMPYNGPATRTTIIDAVNNGLKSTGNFDSSSGISQYDILNNTLGEVQNAGNSIFQLKLILNRNVFKYIPNAKTACIFPTEPIRNNQYNNNETFTIWKYQTNPSTQFSCFFFDNIVNELTYITSETPSVNSSYILNGVTTVYLRCTTPEYANTGNDISMNVPNGIYTLSQYISAINGIFQTYNTKTNTSTFNTINTVASIDTSNYFNLQVDITKPFVNKDYNCSIGNPTYGTSILYNSDYNTHGSFPYAPDISGNSIIRGNIDVATGGYFFNNNTYLFSILPKSTSTNKNGPVISVNLPSNQTYFTNIDTLTAGIKSAITTTSVTIAEIADTQYPFSKSSITYSLSNDGTYYSVAINLQCYYLLSESNYDISFSDTSTSNTSNINNWKAMHLDASYNLFNQKKNTSTSPISYYPYAIIKGNQAISTNQITITNNNNTLVFNSTSNVPSDQITISIVPGNYSLNGLYNAINTSLASNPKTYGSTIQQYTLNGIVYSQIKLNINNVFTTSDFNLVFYDPISFITCFSGSKSVQNTTWDTTIGWILGFRDYTQYSLIQSNQVQNSNFTNIYYYLRSINGYFYYTPTMSNGGQLLNANIQLTADTTLSTELFNYFLISLDDYIQNHLNDGLVTISRSQTAIQTPGVQYATTETCDPATHTLVKTIAPQVDSNNITTLGLYSANQSQISQQNPSKQYSPGPYIKDLFGIIPVKVPNNPGDTYTEFGGSLQNQERLYFGPVNIRKMTIQLLNDRGELVDLNGSNWTFSFICEQLYRSSSTES
jgi:hypothetical protein